MGGRALETSRFDAGRAALWKTCGVCELSGRVGRETVAQALQQRREILDAVLRGFGLRFRGRIQPAVPDDDVKPFDLVDQHQDRLAGSCYFRALIGLQPLGPPGQQSELLGIESGVWHLPILERLGRHLRSADYEPEARERERGHVPCLPGFAAAARSNGWSNDSCLAEPDRENPQEPITIWRGVEFRAEPAC
jgi:hypothetical protein